MFSSGINFIPCLVKIFGLVQTLKCIESVTAWWLPFQEKKAKIIHRNGRGRFKVSSGVGRRVEKSNSYFNQNSWPPG